MEYFFLCAKKYLLWNIGFQTIPQDTSINLLRDLNTSLGG